MKKLDKDILKTLRDYYLLSVRGMALSADEGPEYRRHENAAAQTSCTVFTLFGHVAAETLRKDGIREWNRTSRGVTLAAILSLLRPYDHVFIERSTGPQELEAVGKGTVQELHTIKRVETCGDCKVEIEGGGMRHLGDITAISGYDAPMVDVVIGGSPCQDLSVAGKRVGLAGARSGLFMEQIRLIKELRNTDIRRGRTGQFIRPRFMVWENVPGAFSSNKGNDFRAVLEETIRIAEPDASDIPLPTKGKRPLADCWMGDSWFVVYRVLDAQFWGVPQRRRRIALVADFGGHVAPETLCPQRRVRGYCGGQSGGGRSCRRNWKRYLSGNRKKPNRKI